MKIVYWSSNSENTHRLVQKLNIENIRLPLNRKDEVIVDEPFILILPTYGDTPATVLPPAVALFLSNFINREHLAGVIGGGNIDFGANYCLAARVVSFSYRTRLLYRFELTGTILDVQNIQNIVNEMKKATKNGSNS